MIINHEDGSGEFINHPDGFPQAVCVDVIDQGIKDTKFGPKPRVTLVWESSVMMPDGQKPYIVRANYNASMAPGSFLRKSLESWRGAKFSDVELKGGFDLDKLIGQNCQLQIVTSEPNAEGRTWANVTVIVPLSAGMTPIVSKGGYVRVQDRPQGGPDNDTAKF